MSNQGSVLDFPRCSDSGLENTHAVLEVPKASRSCAEGQSRLPIFIH